MNLDFDTQEECIYTIYTPMYLYPFIQCSLTGTALRRYICSNGSYKHGWHAFVQSFIQKFSTQKSAYLAQLETLNLVKKDNEGVRHFALKVQQLVEKDYCNENDSTKYLNCI